jgi:hypothetical protein
MLHELRQQRRQLLEAESGGGGEPDQPAGDRRFFQDLRFHRRAVGQDAGGAFERLPAALRQRQSARRAMQERRLQPLFQPGDGLGNRRLGEAELLRGVAERSAFGDLCEDRPSLEIRQMRHYLSSPWRQ